jgi:hypothetical protein
VELRFQLRFEGQEPLQLRRDLWLILLSSLQFDNGSQEDNKRNSLLIIIGLPKRHKKADFERSTRNLFKDGSGCPWRYGCKCVWAIIISVRRFRLSQHPPTLSKITLYSEKFKTFVSFLSTFERRKEKIYGLLPCTV